MKNIINCFRFYKKSLLENIRGAEYFCHLNCVIWHRSRESTPIWKHILMLLKFLERKFIKRRRRTTNAKIWWRFFPNKKLSHTKFQVYISNDFFYMSHKQLFKITMTFNQVKI
jgi:hypothetical protein